MASAEVISSVMPSEKNSWSASPERLRKGSTAIEMALAGSAAAARSATIPGWAAHERKLPIGNERGRDNQHAGQDGQRCTQPEDRPQSAAVAVRWTHRSGAPCLREARSASAAPERLFAPRRRERSPRKQARLGLGLGIEFGAQRVGERTIELDRGAAPAALAIVAHQAAHRRLMQRLEPQNPQAGLDCALGLAALGELRHQPGENIDRLIPVARRFRAAPGFELFALDDEPIEEFAGVELRRCFQLRPARLGREAAKRQRIDVESRDVEHDVFALGGNNPMLGIAKRFAQVP